MIQGFSMIYRVLHNQNVISYFLKLSALVLTFSWTCFYVENYKYYLPYFPFKLILFGLIFAINSNMGIWLAAIPFAQKRKLLTVLFLFPSLICNTIIFPMINYQFFLLSMIVGIFINVLALKTLFSSNKEIHQYARPH